MKKQILSFGVAMLCASAFLPSSAHADKALEETAAYGYDSYTCGELVNLEYEKIGSIVYYIRGHYDAKNDIWADYSPEKQTVLEEDFYLPVEDVYDYCSKNPKSTVIEAITTYNN